MWKQSTMTKNMVARKEVHPLKKAERHFFIVLLIPPSSFAKTGWLMGGTAGKLKGAIKVNWQREKEARGIRRRQAAGSLTATRPDYPRLLCNPS